MADSKTPNWYLKEWAALKDKIQASLTNELGWNKSKANLVWHGKQSYNREIVNELAGWLGIEPFELLMPPEEALKLRQLREAAFAIAANHPIAADPGRSVEPSPRRRRG